MQKLNSIYVVEDDSASRTMMLDFLEQYKGVLVKGFMTGEMCIGEMIHSKVYPDIVLMDYYLDTSRVAKYTGIDTLAKIKELSPNTRIIMVTSVDHDRIVEGSKEMGASDYVMKGPKAFEEVKSIIDKNYTV